MPWLCDQLKTGETLYPSGLTRGWALWYRRWDMMSSVARGEDRPDLRKRSYSHWESVRRGALTSFGLDLDAVSVFCEGRAYSTVGLTGLAAMTGFGASLS